VALLYNRVTNGNNITSIHHLVHRWRDNSDCRAAMIEIWFLLVLMTIQDTTPLIYKSFMGYESQEVCEEMAVLAKDFMMEIEMRRGTGDERTIKMESFCIPFEIFESEKPKGPKVGA